eukprot:symbB.v1.2.033233.t1/scaffold4101.1/size44675/5
MAKASLDSPLPGSHSNWASLMPPPLPEGVAAQAPLLQALQALQLQQQQLQQLQIQSVQQLISGSLLGSSMLGMPLPGDPNLSVTCRFPSHILALKGCQPPKSPKPRAGSWLKQ